MAKLLLVDDDEGTLTWMGAALTSAGHVVHTAGSGCAALETAGAWTPDLILADIMMPEMDGFAFSRLVQAHGRVPVMLVSALKKEAEAVLRGVAGYVQKPVTAAELRAAVDRVLGASAIGAILVVDDDPDIRQCYRYTLEPRFAVLEAEDGRVALDLLATRDVALLIVDVHMPVMNGVGFLVRAIRDDPRFRAVPVIVQTSDRAATYAPIWTDLQVEQTVMKNDFMEWLIAHIDDHLAATLRA